MKKKVTKDYYKECERLTSKFLKQRKEAYHISLNVNDESAVHDDYTKGFIYQEKGGFVQN